MIELFKNVIEKPCLLQEILSIVHLRCRIQSVLSAQKRALSPVSCHNPRRFRERLHESTENSCYLHELFKVSAGLLLHS